MYSHGIRGILLLGFCEHCSLCLVTTLLWMALNTICSQWFQRPFPNWSIDTRRPRRFRVMPLCNILFNLNSNINNISFLRSMPRITAVDERNNFSKALKISQILVFWTPVLSGSYDVWGGTHSTNPVKQKIIYVTFSSYLTNMQETICLALQVKRSSSLPTVRDQTNIVKKRSSTQLETFAFDSKVTSHSDATASDTTTATPCGQNSEISQMD